MLGAFLWNPTSILLVNPKYIYPYIAGGTHLTSYGYRWMGEYYAKAYWTQVVLGQQWKPLYPVSISGSGNTITIQFHVPVPPLVLDTTNVVQLADGNYGFEDWTSGSYNATGITAVNITDATNGIVQLTLSHSAPANGAGMRYAYSGAPTGPGGMATIIGQTNLNAGVTTGCRGCLRDSDPLVGPVDGLPLYNWCVHFSVLSDGSL
jgi:hypothetical protein